MEALLSVLQALGWGGAAASLGVGCLMGFLTWWSLRANRK